MIPDEAFEWAYQRAELIRDAQKKSSLLSSLEQALGIDSKTLDVIDTPDKQLAHSLFFGLRYGYGFSESIESGNWVPWPHEMGQANCFSQAIANYMVADELGLEPSLVEFVGHSQEGGGITDHCITFVDVGGQDLWALDQGYRTFGPTIFGDQHLTIDNLYSLIDSSTERQSYRDYLVRHTSDLDSLAQRVVELKKTPHLVLVGGQKLGVPEVDRWMSRQAGQTNWFLGLDEQDRTVTSRITIRRPGVQQRGLEFAVETDTQKERVSGYFCESFGWNHFVGGREVVRFLPEEIGEVLDELQGIPTDQVLAYEQTQAQLSGYDSRIAAIAKASRERIGNNYITLVSAVEALYQNEIGNSGRYLTRPAREAALTRLRPTDEYFEAYAASRKREKRTLRGAKRGSPEERHRIFANYRTQIGLISERQGMSLSEEQLQSIRTPQDAIEHMLALEPVFVDEGVDRATFYNVRIKGKEGTIMDMAKQRFGDNLDAAIAGGYRRICTEFLGMISYAREPLYMSGFKETTVATVKNSVAALLT